MHNETHLQQRRGVQPLNQRTKAYALDIIKLYGVLPRTTVAQVIGKQLLRSGTSVGANYCEAARARSDAELLSKFGICIQELEETRYWIELLEEGTTVDTTMLTPLLDETRQLLAIFTTCSRNIKKR